MIFFIFFVLDVVVCWIVLFIDQNEQGTADAARNALFFDFLGMEDIWGFRLICLCYSKQKHPRVKEDSFVQNRRVNIILCNESKSQVGLAFLF